MQLSKKSAIACRAPLRVLAVAKPSATYRPRRASPSVMQLNATAVPREFPSMGARAARNRAQRRGGGG